MSFVKLFNDNLGLLWFYIFSSFIPGIDHMNLVANENDLFLNFIIVSKNE